MKGMRRVIAVVALLQALAVETFAFSGLPYTTRNHPIETSFHRTSKRNTLKQPHTAKQRVTSRDSAVGPLEAAPILSLFSSPIGSLAILAGIVLVHESGHYLAARSFGIEVEEFSIGFGPKLFGFQALGNEFNLRALPLGGYVRFPENYNVTEVQEQQRAAYEAAKERRKEKDADVGSEILNILTFGALEDREKGKEKAQRLQKAEELASLPWWKKIGAKKDVEAATPIAPDDIEIEYDDNPDLLQNRPWQQRAVVLSAGVVFNLLLSFSIYFGQIGFGPGLPQPIFDQGIVVNAAPRRDAPASGILNKGDVIVEVNGSPVSRSPSPSAFESQRAINDFIATIRSTPEGESLKLSVMHPNSAKPEEVSIQPRRQLLDKGEVGPLSIGVLLTPNFVKADVLKTNNLIEAAGMAQNYVTTLTKETANGLLSFAGEMFSGKAASSSNQVSGPIGLIRTGSEVVASQDWTAVLLFAAAISINLGVVNAFPLPALDGGQLIFVLAEAVTGRKVDQRLQEGITGAALFFLLLVSLGAAVGDIENIFGI